MKKTLAKQIPKQKLKPCHTCPWIPTIFGNCFSPEALEKTIVADMLNDRMQRCHGNHNYVCAGALAFLNNHGDLYANAGIRVAAMTKVIDPCKINSDIETFESISEMLESHSVRSGIPAGDADAI